MRDRQAGREKGERHVGKKGDRKVRDMEEGRRGGR